MELQMKYSFDNPENEEMWFGIAEKDKINKNLMHVINWAFFTCREELCYEIINKCEDRKFKIVIIIPFYCDKPNLKTVRELEAKYGLKKTVLKKFTNIYSSYEDNSKEIIEHCFYLILDKKWTNTTIMLSEFLSVIRHDTTGEISSTYKYDFENAELILKNYKYILGNKTFRTQEYDKYDFDMGDIGIRAFGKGYSIFKNEYEKFKKIRGQS
jgi:hypothetical protein